MMKGDRFNRDRNWNSWDIWKTWDSESHVCTSITRIVSYMTQAKSYPPSLPVYPSFHFILKMVLRFFCSPYSTDGLWESGNLAHWEQSSDKPSLPVNGLTESIHLQGLHCNFFFSLTSTNHPYSTHIPPIPSSSLISLFFGFENRLNPNAYPRFPSFSYFLSYLHTYISSRTSWLDDRSADSFKCHPTNPFWTSLKAVLFITFEF